MGVREKIGELEKIRKTEDRANSRIRRTRKRFRCEEIKKPTGIGVYEEVPNAGECEEDITDNKSPISVDHEEVSDIKKRETATGQRV